MLLTVLAALAQDPPVNEPGQDLPVVDRPEDLAQEMALVPVSEGAFQVIVRVLDEPPVVRIAGVEVSLLDDGQGVDAAASDGVFSGEVEAPGQGSVVVLVDGEEAFSDEVPLNAGERVRIVMSERGPTLSFEPAEMEPPKAAGAAPSQSWTPPEGSNTGSLGQVALAAGAALVFGVLVGGWLGPDILGRRRGRAPSERCGLKLDGRTLWSCEDREAVIALLSSAGRTLLLRGELNADAVLDAADEAGSALLLVRLEELAEGELAEVLKEAPANLLLLAEGEHPQASGALRVCDGSLVEG